MAFNRKYFNIFKTLLPKAHSFKIIIQKNLTQFFEGLTTIPDDFREYIDTIYFDLFPSTTNSIDLWEDQFGIRGVPQDDEDRKRDILELQWTLEGGQSAYYLQTKLQEAGFDVQVHENNPQIDPDTFINANFVCYCGGTNSVCGNDDAFAGKTGGLILANGFIPNSTDIRDYLCVCGYDGFDNVTAGQSIACCGYFEEFIIEPLTYSVPDDSDYWGYMFFIGGDATRNAITHVLETIEIVDIESSRQMEFENLILKIKPVHTWAGLIIDYV